MLKKMQIKIVLLFMFLGIIILLVFGSVYISNLNTIYVGLDKVNHFELIIKLEEQIQNAKIILVIAIWTFVFFSIFVGILISRTLILPINKLVKSAEKIATGEKLEIGKITKKKKETDIDELVNAFSITTTELKDNLDDASKQKKQIEAILTHIADGIIAFNLEGKIVHINPAAYDLLKIPKSFKSFDQIFKKINIDVNLEKIIYLESWTSTEQKLELEGKYINIFFVPFKTEDDRPGGAVVLVQDITEHVNLENMQREFVADVSHELKTPITSIMGYAETLIDGEYDKELQDKFLNVIADEGRRMTKLVNDLLNLSRYDNNEMKWEKTEFDLGKLVQSIKEKLMIEIEKKNHHIENFITANVPNVYADKDGIERVLLNILSNSIKYTPENGDIKIYVGFVYNDAYIKIIDNGIGIPTEDLDRIFERFYRVDKARTRELGGTGLGLSIAKEILDKNYGSIKIKSTVGEGTEVVIRIPTRQKI